MSFHQVFDTALQSISNIMSEEVRKRSCLYSITLVKFCKFDLVETLLNIEAKVSRFLSRDVPSAQGARMSTLGFGRFFLQRLC